MRSGLYVTKVCQSSAAIHGECEIFYERMFAQSAGSVYLLKRLPGLQCGELCGALRGLVQLNCGILHSALSVCKANQKPCYADAFFYRSWFLRVVNLVQSKYTSSVRPKKISHWANVCFSEHAIARGAQPGARTYMHWSVSSVTRAMQYIYNIKLGLLQVRENEISLRK